MHTLTLTPEFSLAFRFITETNQNVFLTGKAGTGKTTFLRYLRENCTKKLAVAAPTGVAAINAGGVTLHSLFHLPFMPYIPGNEIRPDAVNSHTLLSHLRYNSDKLTLLRNLELLIIDEASMVSCYTVDAIDTILKSVRRNSTQPFGGVQVLFIGDLYQLQPVIKSDEWEFLKKYYPSAFFFDSHTLQKNVPVMIELKEIFRQKDPGFVELLNGIRHDSLTPEHFDLLASRLKAGFVPAADEGYITLTTHNRQSDRINAECLERLKSKKISYAPLIGGDFPEHMYPTDPRLELKTGAQIMFVKNDLEERKYYNGKTGVVVSLSDDKIIVRCRDDEKDITVRKYTWRNIRYAVNHKTREITETDLGTYTHYPLRLAWAVTIHKSQGLTFDKVIIDAENAFANGQVYVALSRCTSLEGLILTSPVSRKFLGAHQQLTDWQEKHRRDEGLKELFSQSRLKFAGDEIISVFRWHEWTNEMQELSRFVNSEEKAGDSAKGWMKEMFSSQRELCATAEKFIAQMKAMMMSNPDPEQNTALQERISKAAAYFIDELQKWKLRFIAHPLSAETKKSARKIDALLQEVNIQLHEILHRLSACRNGFRLNEFLEKRKLHSGDIPVLPGTYAKNQQAPETTENPDLFDKLSDMRRRISGEKGKPLYQVFSNETIFNICEQLPADMEALHLVKGFGKVKVKQFGKEIIRLVREYCEENNLSPKNFSALYKEKEKKSRQAPVSQSVSESIRLFRELKNIEAVATERNLAVSTIESHLATAIGKGSFDIEEYPGIEEANKLAALFPSDSLTPNLSAIISKAPGVSYGKLRMVWQWMQRSKEEKPAMTDNY